MRKHIRTTIQGGGAPATKSGTGDMLADSAINEYIEIVGLNTAADGTCSLVVGHPGAAPSKAFSIPLALLADGRHSQLQELLLKRGHLTVAKRFSPKEISSVLGHAAEACTVRVMDREGVHDVEIGGASHRIFVKGGDSHWLTPKPASAEVVLVGAAAIKSCPEKSLEQFNQSLAPILVGCPRLLVVLCFALSAMFARLYGIVPINLGIIGLTSQGKTIAQRFASLVVGGRDDVQSMNATVIGFHDYMAEHPDQAVYFEDAHGGQAGAPLVQGIMDAGNAGRRLRGKWSTSSGAADQVTCTLIYSAERGVIETARAARQQINSGLFARLLELGMGKHGMFDALCGFESAASLAKFVKGEAPHYRGLIGDALVKEIAAHSVEVHSLWRKHESSIRGSILDMAELDEVEGLNGRLLDGLVFVAFIGCLLVRFKLVAMKRSDVYRAFGQVFSEHVARLKASTSPVAQAVVDAVRHFIQTNQGRFVPLVQAGGATTPNGIAGYVKRGASGEGLYLFFPSVFRKTFTDEFGTEAFGHLREAGYLEAQLSRHNLLSVRIRAAGEVKGKSAGGKTPRQDFVAIRESILYSDGPA